MADAKTETRSATLSVDEAARLLGRSARWIHKLREDGFVETVGRGRYPLVGLVRGAVRYLEEKAANATAAATGNRATAARTKEIELRIAMRQRELIPVELVHEMFAEHAQLVVSRLEGLPARLSRDMGMRAAVQAEVDRIRNEIAADLKAKARALMAGEIEETTT